MECGMQVRPPQAERLEKTRNPFNKLRGNDRTPNGPRRRPRAWRLGCAANLAAQESVARPARGGSRPKAFLELQQFRQLSGALETHSAVQSHSRP